ncbi:MAG: hypothetical protein J1F32_02985 [Erysipelotrichales bacterium]|nr:hypothetical protein [Erysipelotrichales bacterium]
MEEKTEWKFGVAANIVHSHTDEDGNVYYGTKAFTPGTKVYLDGKFWNSKSDDIFVIGRNRFGRFVHERVPVALLENVRTQRIYHPKVLKIMKHLEFLDGWEWWENTIEDKKDTKRFVKEWLGRMKV